MTLFAFDRAISRRCRLLLPVLCVLITMTSSAQVNPNSPVFRNYRPPKQELPTQQESLERQVSDFMLMRQANAGDRDAQHELGLRYLFGDRFPRDTVAASAWIAKAAAKNLPAARYNYALMQSNGWGVPWNPFEAYLNFRYAAERGMPEAEYMVGGLYSDGLVLPRNWREAARWTKKAADAGFAPAKAALADMLTRGYIQPADTATLTMKTVPGKPGESFAIPPAEKRSGWSPIFLDFTADTGKAAAPDLHQLWSAVRGTFPIDTTDSIAIERAIEHRTPAAASFNVHLASVTTAADAGNADATAFLAKCRDDGVMLTQNSARAIAGYVRAMFLDAPTAGPLLAEMVGRKDFLRDIEHQAAAGDPQAEYTVAGLAALGIVRSADEARAKELLAKASARGYEPAVILEGINRSTGRWGARDLKKAAATWARAKSAGSREAAVRLAALAALSDAPVDDVASELDVLRGAAEQGAVIATVSLAYCHETGRGFIMSAGEAVRLYREAAMRGSRTAYRALHRMHDALRPNSAEFDVEE